MKPVPDRSWTRERRQKTGRAKGMPGFYFYRLRTVKVYGLPRLSARPYKGIDEESGRELLEKLPSKRGFRPESSKDAGGTPALPVF